MIDIFKQLQKDSGDWRSHTFLIKTNLKEDFVQIIQMLKKQLPDHELSIYDSEENLFSVSQVRQVQKDLIIKPLAPRIILINARKLALVSQNAMLKLLEDPHDKTTIIVCVAANNQILPTLKSRVQTINLEIDCQNSAINDFHNKMLPDQLGLWDQIKENDLLGMLLADHIKTLSSQGGETDQFLLREITNLYQGWQSGVLAPKYVYEAFCLLGAKQN